MTLTKAQIQLAEKLADKNGLTYRLMMENAGVMAHKYIQTKLDVGLDGESRYVILAGNGNNGGDAFVVARLLCEQRARVTLVMCMSVPLTPLAIENFELLRGLDIAIIDIDIDDGMDCALENIENAQIIIDGIFGISFHGELPINIEKVLTFANKAKGIRVALDIPSGINCDTGIACLGSFNAAYTLSFAAYKPAHSNEKASASCGIVEVLDIGIPSNIIYAVLNYTTKITELIVSNMLPKRAATSNKGDFGKLLNIAGSASMAGASMMSTLAAMRSGAGIVRLATTESVAKMVAPNLMEAMTTGLFEGVDGAISMNSITEIGHLLQKSTACLLGCGISISANTKQMVEYVLLNANCNLIIDADGLNCIAGKTELLKQVKKPAIITPHIGEMARLVEMSIDDVIENAQNIAKIFAKEYGCVVVLKSHKTLIATPNGELYENTTGNAGLAKGGSGDVLAGMIAALVAQGLPLRDAAICGVYLHGDCADSLSKKMSLYSMLARDIIAEIPFAFMRVEA